MMARMGGLTRALCASIVLNWGAMCLRAQPAPAGAAGGNRTLVSAELLSDASAIRPGAPFTVGVMLHVEPGWHIYWKNPGDSGIATSVKVTLPDGYKAGSVQYPVPQKFAERGGITAYGYEGQVMLLVPVTAPADIKPGATVPISADVAWLCCREQCTPGQAQLNATVSVAQQTAPANQDTFRQWTQRLPAPINPDGTQPQQTAAETDTEAAPAGDMDSSVLSIEHTASARADGATELTIKVQWDPEPVDVEVFPAPGPWLNVSDVHAQTEGGTTTIHLLAKPLAGARQVEKMLPIVLGFTDGFGSRRGVEGVFSLSIAPDAGQHRAEP
jgi:DsbC/DsbD-like thiol-disulfide interchange protein